MITQQMIAAAKRPTATKVMFLKPIFSEDFPDRGMTAWLIDYYRSEDDECYRLFFDFEDFEDINKKYFKRDYRDNSIIQNRISKGLVLETADKLYTAYDAGYYNPKYTVFFGDIHQTEDEMLIDLFNNYLTVIE